MTQEDWDRSAMVSRKHPLPEPKISKGGLVIIGGLRDRGYRVTTDFEGRRIEITPPEGISFSSVQTQAIRDELVGNCGFGVQLNDDLYPDRSAASSTIEGEVTGRHEGGIGRLGPGQKALGPGSPRTRNRR